MALGDYNNFFTFFTIFLVLIVMFILSIDFISFIIFVELIFINFLVFIIKCGFEQGDILGSHMLFVVFLVLLAGESVVALSSVLNSYGLTENIFVIKNF